MYGVLFIDMAPASHYVEGQRDHFWSPLGNGWTKGAPGWSTEGINGIKRPVSP